MKYVNDDECRGSSEYFACILCRGHDGSPQGSLSTSFMEKRTKHSIRPFNVVEEEDDNNEQSSEADEADEEEEGSDDEKHAFFLLPLSLQHSRPTKQWSCLRRLSSYLEGKPNFSSSFHHLFSVFPF